MVKIKIRKKVCKHNNCAVSCWLCKLPPAQVKAAKA